VATQEEIFPKVEVGDAKAVVFFRFRNFVVFQTIGFAPMDEPIYLKEVSESNNLHFLWHCRDAKNRH
jgi:hypothetical protein